MHSIYRHLKWKVWLQIFECELVSCSDSCGSPITCNIVFWRVYSIWSMRWSRRWWGVKKAHITWFDLAISYLTIWWSMKKSNYMWRAFYTLLCISQLKPLCKFMRSFLCMFVYHLIFELLSWSSLALFCKGQTKYSMLEHFHCIFRLARYLISNKEIYLRFLEISWTIF